MISFIRSLYFAPLPFSHVLFCNVPYVLGSLPKSSGCLFKRFFSHDRIQDSFTPLALDSFLREYPRNAHQSCMKVLRDAAAVGVLPKEVTLARVACAAFGRNDLAFGTELWNFFETCKLSVPPVVFESRILSYSRASIHLYLESSPFDVLEHFKRSTLHFDRYNDCKRLLETMKVSGMPVSTLIYVAMMEMSAYFGEFGTAYDWFSKLIDDKCIPNHHSLLICQLITPVKMPNNCLPSLPPEKGLTANECIRFLNLVAHFGSISVFLKISEAYKPLIESSKFAREWRNAYIVCLAHDNVLKAFDHWEKSKQMSMTKCLFLLCKLTKIKAATQAAVLTRAILKFPNKVSIHYDLLLHSWLEMNPKKAFTLLIHMVDNIKKCADDGAMKNLPSAIIIERVLIATSAYAPSWPLLDLFKLQASHQQYQIVLRTLCEKYVLHNLAVVEKLMPEFSPGFDISRLKLLYQVQKAKYNK